VPGKKPTGDDAPGSYELTEPDVRIVHALRRLVRALEINSRRLAAETGVTSAQLSCMKMLDLEDVDTATEVARRVHLSPSTVVGILDRLEDRKYITRQRDGRDRRVVRVKLTKEGKALVRKTPHPVRNLLELQRNGLTESDANRIADSLEKLVGVLGATELEVDSPYSDLSEDGETNGA
jgi:DNA-binding MarR family transcriptional regulator